jgi:hypothetical protein
MVGLYDQQHIHLRWEGYGLTGDIYEPQVFTAGIVNTQSQRTISFTFTLTLI